MRLFLCLLQALHDCISVLDASTFQRAEQLLQGHFQAADIVRTMQFCRHLGDVELQDLVYKIRLEDDAYKGWYSSRPQQTPANDTVSGINMFSLYPLLDPSHHLHDMWREFSAQLELQAAQLAARHRPTLSKEEQREYAEAAALQKPLPVPAEQERAEKRLAEAILAREDAKKPRAVEPASQPPLRLCDITRSLDGMGQFAAYQALLPNLGAANGVRAVWTMFNQPQAGLPVSLREILDTFHTGHWLSKYVPEGPLGWKRKLLGAICIRIRGGMEESAAVAELGRLVYEEWSRTNNRGIDCWARIKGELPVVYLRNWWRTK